MSYLILNMCNMIYNPFITTKVGPLPFHVQYNYINFSPDSYRKLSSKITDEASKEKKQEKLLRHLTIIIHTRTCYSMVCQICFEYAVMISIFYSINNVFFGFNNRTSQEYYVVHPATSEEKHLVCMNNACPWWEKCE